MKTTSRLVQFGLAFLAIAFTAGLVYADEGLYLSAAVGSTDLEQSTDFPIDDNATAFRFGVGFGLANDIALEASYLNLGEFTGNTGFNSIGIDGEVEGAAISAVFALPLSDTWSATARAGFMAWESRLSTPGFREKRDGTDPFYGLGLEAGFSERFAITGEWQRYELDDAEADVLFVGARFRF